MRCPAVLADDASIRIRENALPNKMGGLDIDSVPPAMPISVCHLGWNHKLL